MLPGIPARCQCDRGSGPLINHLTEGTVAIASGGALGQLWFDPDLEFDWRGVAWTRSRSLSGARRILRFARSVQSGRGLVARLDAEPRSTPAVVARRALRHVCALGRVFQLGNEFHGRPGGGYAEHIQRVLKIPIPEYRAEVAGHFDPVHFDADAWIRAAKEAGMGYFVITAKHHDGFAMWPTRVNDYNVMDATPWHHDPMADLRAACRKYGIKFGFYYSHAFDWGNEFAPGNDWDYHNPAGLAHRRALLVENEAGVRALRAEIRR